MPEPCTPSIGLGMNVACTPAAMATSRTIRRSVMTLSAIAEAVGVAQVDLVLGRRVLVERVLDRDAGGLEALDGARGGCRCDSSKVVRSK